MVLFIGASNHFVISSPLIQNRSNFFSLAFMIHPSRKKSCSFDLLMVNERSLRCPVLLFQSSSCSGLSQKRRRRRSKGEEVEGDFALEAEILEFMQKSKNPNVFPSKEELVEAGRMDLVEGIVKQGGWLSLGWNLNEEVELVQKDEILNSKMREEVDDDDCRIFQERFDGGNGDSSSLVGNEIESSSNTNSSYPPSSSSSAWRVEDAGIEGILSRLEKERNLLYGLDSKENESKDLVLRNDDEDDWQIRNSAVADSERSSRPTSPSPCKDSFNDSSGMHLRSESFSELDFTGSPLKPDMWRKWSIQRSGFSDTEFEAAEIGECVANNDEMSAKAANEKRNIRADLNFGNKENNHDQIRSRLQHLELELASVLHLIRTQSQTHVDVSNKDNQNSSQELHKLYDAWEFQETEIMNARAKLRSTRVKLAVSEGKMALAITEAQKTLEAKQKKLDDARKVLHILRTACIVWPNSASEVLLVGSFDGWTSQRRMERSSSGIFSLYLKLYPGRYEIKFIVDGIWMVDPLRPIVRNNGYENNLLIMS